MRKTSTDKKIFFDLSSVNLVRNENPEKVYLIIFYCVDASGLLQQVFLFSDTV